MKPIFLALAIILTIPIRSHWAMPVPRDNTDLGPQIQSPVLPKYFTLETLTVYNPIENQCDSSPLITASNAHIDLNKLKLSKIRWMALSRNLLKKWDGEFNYGDTVMLKSGDPDIDGLWVINDNMNKRFKDRGDLLFHHESRKIGKWKNVKIAKWDPKAIASI
jgi:hypothetical protein